MQVVFVCFIVWIGNQLDFGIDYVGDYFGQVVDVVCFGYLVYDLDFVICCWWVFDCKLDIVYCVLDVDEGVGLVVCVVYGQWIIYSGLYQEVVEYCFIVIVIVEMIDQVCIMFGFFGLGVLDNVLVEIGDFYFVVFVVEVKEELILGFGYVVD